MRLNLQLLRLPGPFPADFNTHSIQSHGIGHCQHRPLPTKWVHDRPARGELQHEAAGRSTCGSTHPPGPGFIASCWQDVRRRLRWMQLHSLGETEHVVVAWFAICCTAWRYTTDYLVPQESMSSVFSSFLYQVRLVYPNSVNFDVRLEKYGGTIVWAARQDQLGCCCEPCPPLGDATGGAVAMQL
jgi:hypothetical protein